jgi:hypothetical protein
MRYGSLVRVEIYSAGCILQHSHSWSFCLCGFLCFAASYGVCEWSWGIWFLALGLGFCGRECEALLDMSIEYQSPGSSLFRVVT